MRYPVLLGFFIAMFAASGAVAGTRDFTIANVGGPSGSHPNGQLLVDAQDRLYGTMASGGTSNNGVIFRMTSAGTPPYYVGYNWGSQDYSEDVLYNFAGGADGRSPSSLVMGGDGALYGVTYNGGASDQGTVFKLAPPAPGQTAWTKSILYSFAGGADGASPGSIIPSGDGGFYGTTSAAPGTIFKLSPNGAGWTKTILSTFAGGADGTASSQLTRDGNGNLFGATSDGGGTSYCGGGCGTVFQLSPPAPGGAAWTRKSLYSFGSANDKDGTRPTGGFVITAAGAIYGATSEGGSPESFGSLFKLTPPAPGQSAWTETVVHRFPRNTRGGIYPNGGLVADSAGALYGTTYGGGSDCGADIEGGCGTTFRVAPKINANGTQNLTVLFRLSRGINPIAGVAIDSTGAIFGSAYNGSYPHPFGVGTVFKQIGAQVKP